MGKWTDRQSKVRRLLSEEHGLPRGAKCRTGELGRLCAAVTRGLPASDAGMSATVRAAPLMLLAASGEHAEHLEELQATLGQGPRVDAVTYRRPVFESDLGVWGQRRWPAYAAAARDLGVGAVFAFPVQVGAVYLGVLDVYRQDCGSLSDTGLADALAFAELTMEILLDDQPEALAQSHLPLGAGLTPLVLYQAQGMVTVQLGSPRPRRWPGSVDVLTLTTGTWAKLLTTLSAVAFF